MQCFLLLPTKWQECECSTLMCLFSHIPHWLCFVQTMFSSGEWRGKWGITHGRVPANPQHYQNLASCTRLWQSFYSTSGLQNSQLQRTCQPSLSATDKTSCTQSSHSTRSGRIFKAGGNIAPASHPVAPWSALWASRFKSRADSHCTLASFHGWQRYWCWACTWCRCNCLTFEWKHCQCSCHFFCCCSKG